MALTCSRKQYGCAWPRHARKVEQMQAAVDAAQELTGAVRTSLHEAKVKLERQQDQAVRLCWCLCIDWPCSLVGYCTLCG